MNGDEPIGRGAAFNTPNRFERTAIETIKDDIVVEDDEGRPLRTTYYLDRSRSALAKNDAPDVPFTYSINPYRGCEHGCIYCYARPSHEYLGFSAGLDFESKIVVKPDIATLLDVDLGKRGWEPQIVCLSGNTDCYQPAERHFRTTRAVLEVFLARRNPVGLITKNALVMRDLDLLARLAEQKLVTATVSITTLDPEIARAMEPRASTPARRLEALLALAAAGVPTGVNVAPIIPGLTDEELPEILRAAAARGARYAGYSLCRLQGAIEPLFRDWLARTMPDRAEKVMARIRDVHGDDLAGAGYHVRMRGRGPYAEAIARMFEVMTKRLGLDGQWPALDATRFVRGKSGRTCGPEIQGELFPS